MGKYHRENAQEGFLVVAGECMLIVEEQERRLATWDYFHCPGGTDHIIIGAGAGPAIVVAVGARGRGIGGGTVYLVSELATRYGAGVERETTSSTEAYAEIFAKLPRSRFVPTSPDRCPAATDRATRWILSRDGLSVGDALAGSVGAARPAR